MSGVQVHIGGRWEARGNRMNEIATGGVVLPGPVHNAGNI